MWCSIESVTDPEMYTAKTCILHAGNGLKTSFRRVAMAALALTLSGTSVGAISNDVSIQGKAAGSERSKLAGHPLGLFISGHSLTDEPLPQYLEAIAESLGTAVLWNQQSIVGSSIRTRTRGDDPTDKHWSGYSRGKNRHGSNLNIVDELKSPRALGADRYDILLITEQHTLLGSLIWNDTIRHLRHFHERLIDGNAHARTYLYHSWISVNDKSDPRRWIAYEREADQLWRCVAERINVSLAGEGRKDRIASLPAAAALAALVEKVTQGAGLPGFSGTSPRQTMDRLFKDDVHLTPLGSYYMALVSYAAVFQRSPVGAWAPSDVAPSDAAVLQSAAWDFVSQYPDHASSLETCREFLLQAFIDTYWAYIRDTYWIGESGRIHAYAKWIRHTVSWRYRFWRTNPDNPLDATPLYVESTLRD